MPFLPVALNALYPGIERGLTADVVAARALGGRALTVCTSLVVAGGGRVTDVLEVPSDTVAAQLEHLFDTSSPTSARLGILGSRESVAAAFDLIGQRLIGPLLLDLTLSGPSGEDIADGGVREALQQRLPLPDLVTLRRSDAELLVGMEIRSIDDAQVAVQRVHRLGARAVLLRAGRLPARDFEEIPNEFAADLLFDGEEFALFEAPYVDTSDLHGASSALCMAILRALEARKSLEEAIQGAKRFVTEALRVRGHEAAPGTPHYFWESAPDPM